EVWRACEPGPGRVRAGFGPVSARRRAWPGSASRRSGGWLRRPCPAGFLHRAHQADVVAVGIGHDRVPGAPEGIKRRLPAPVAGRGQLGVAVIDGLPGREHEPEDHLGAGRVGAPGGVPPPGRLGRVQFQAEAAGHPGGVGMDEASPAVFAAADVHYLPSGGARAAAVLAADAVFSAVLAEQTVLLPQVLPYRPGEFFLRELPPLQAVLAGMSRLGLLVIDGDRKSTRLNSSHVAISYAVF